MTFPPTFARIAATLALLAPPSLTHAASLRLDGAIVHTVSGPSLTNAPVLIRDGRIAAVGPAAAGAAADQVVNLQGLHLFPGLIAPGTILGLIEIDSVRATRDTTEVGEFSPDVHAWIAINPESELIPVARANGFTHAQAIPLGGIVSGQSALVRLDGWTIEDLAERRSTGLHLFWPSHSLDTTPKHLSGAPDKWKSPEDQIQERERQLRSIDAFFDSALAYQRARNAAGLQSTPPLTTDAGAGRRIPTVATNGFTVVPAWESMLPLLQGEIPLFLHADETRQIRSGVQWAVQRGFRTVLAGGRDAARVTQLLATNRIPVAYEHVFTQPVYDTDPYDAQFAVPARLHAAGISVAFTEGTDRFGASNIRNIPYAAAQAVAFGLPRQIAWQGLTLVPARMLGVDDRLGSIEVGKDASLIAVDGDILDIRAKVRRLWIQGRESSLESRHTRLYEKYRNRPKKP
jgi:hypothetical protein